MVVDLNIMLKLIRNIEESAIKDNSIYIVEVSDGLFKLYCGSNVILDSDDLNILDKPLRCSEVYRFLKSRNFNIFGMTYRVDNIDSPILLWDSTNSYLPGDKCFKPLPANETTYTPEGTVWRSKVDNNRQIPGSSEAQYWEDITENPGLDYSEFFNKPWDSYQSYKSGDICFTGRFQVFMSKGYPNTNMDPLVSIDDDFPASYSWYKLSYDGALYARNPFISMGGLVRPVNSEVPYLYNTIYRAKQESENENPITSTAYWDVVDVSELIGISVSDWDPNDLYLTGDLCSLRLPEIDSNIILSSNAGKTRYLNPDVSCWRSKINDNTYPLPQLSSNDNWEKIDIRESTSMNYWRSGQSYNIGYTCVESIDSIEHEYDVIFGDMLPNVGEINMYGSYTGSDLLKGSVMKDLINPTSGIYTNKIRLSDLRDSTIDREGIKCDVNVGIVYTKYDVDNNTHWSHSKSLVFTAFSYESSESGLAVCRTYDFCNTIGSDKEVDIEFDGDVFAVIPRSRDIVECFIQNCYVIYGRI